jgi:two-component system LytT family sensor kinase
MIHQHWGDHTTESRKFPYFWKLQIAYWVTYTLLQGIVGYLLIAAGIILSGSEWLLLEWILLKSACGFMITSSLRPLFIRIHSKMWHPLRMTLLLLGISISYVAVEILLATQIPFLRVHFSSLTATLSIGTSVMVLGFYMDLFFFALWIGLYFAGSLFFDSVELIRRQKSSELALLRNQMQPHFLFNALTAVMAVSDDKEKVETLTQSLADYLRFSLNKSDEDHAPMGEELHALENYLHVEKIRFGENLVCRIDVDQEARSLNTPKHLVQPLLENAIKYGQQTSPMPLSILIHARLADGELHLTVENTGSWVEPSSATSFGKDKDKENGIGIGISNLRRRLHLIYGNLASLTYESSPQRVLARVTLPIVSAGNRRTNLSSHEQEN